MSNLSLFSTSFQQVSPPKKSAFLLLSRTFLHPTAILLLLLIYINYSLASPPPCHTTTDCQLTIADPYENINRKIFAFNQKADTYLLKPLAQAYDAVLPDPVQTGVGNVFSNLAEPITAINSLFQGEGKNALLSTCRFFINSIAGLFGLFDVATLAGVSVQRESFSQTLGVWGFSGGNYLVLPLLGPSSTRSFAGTVADRLVAIPPPLEVSDLQWMGLYTINRRAELLGLGQVLETGSIDPYLFLRQTFVQQQALAIHNNQLPPPEANQELDDELDDLLE